MPRKIKSDSVKLDDVVIETDKNKEFTVAEIKHSTKIFKSATPKYDASWYVKWAASALILIAVMARGSTNVEWSLLELNQQVDLIASCIGTIGWFIVGMLWKDRALILLNGVIVIILGQAIIGAFI